MHLADVHNWIGLYISEKKKKYRNLGKVMIPDISVQLRSPILRTGFVQSMIPDIYKTAVIYNSCIPLIWKLYLLVTCDSIPNSCTSIKLHCIYIFTDVIFCLFVQAQFPPIILQYDAAYQPMSGIHAQIRLLLEVFGCLADICDGNSRERLTGTRTSFLLG